MCNHIYNAIFDTKLHRWHLTCTKCGLFTSSPEMLVSTAVSDERRAAVKRLYGAIIKQEDRDTKEDRRIMAKFGNPLVVAEDGRSRWEIENDD